MPKQVLFIHSAGPQGAGQGSEGLVQQLKAALGEAYKVTAPPMPKPEDPVYEAWKGRLKEELGRLGGDVIAVGHSLGGSVLLKFLAEEPQPAPVTGLITVAAPFWGLDEDWNRKDFFFNEEAADGLSAIPHVTLLHSTHDDIVPYTHLERYARVLPDVKVKLIQGSDHLFQEGLPELAEEVKAAAEA